jgi:hypothetical protein
MASPVFLAESDSENDDAAASEHTGVRSRSRYFIADLFGTMRPDPRPRIY